MPEVSILVNCLNEARYLGDALDSAFAQTFDDWEIVLWDNASTDDSWEIAASYGDKVRCFRSETTIPLSHARNKALAHTQGKYLAILDADDLWLPEKLEQQLALFEANPDVGMTFCDSMLFDEGGDRTTFFKASKPHRGNVFGPLLVRNFISSSAMMFRREALDKLDCAFDERYTRVADYELSLRMAFHYPADYIEAPLSRCRIYGISTKPWKAGWIPRAVEAKLALDNLVETYPEIPERYSTQLKLSYRQLDYVNGMNDWENGNASGARRYLSRHLSNKKFAFVYLCSFVMTHAWFNVLRAFYRNKLAPRL